MRLRRVASKRALVELIDEIGFLPFFANEVDGFSLEECVAPRFWFPFEGEGVWEWKGSVIQDADCAYGKFFRGKAGFVSKKWFYDFANFRRDGYDFDALCDDGFGRHTDIVVYNALSEHNSLLSKALKNLCGFGRGGKSGFEGIITRLQMQCYVLIGDFEYQIDKRGNPYGWGVARYETPEYRFGSGFSERVYKREPASSKERILRHFARVFPKSDLGGLERMLVKGGVKG